MQQVERLLVAASAEARAFSVREISPRSLFAAVFDRAFGVEHEEGSIYPLDPFARQIMSLAAEAGPSLCSLLNALTTSSTHVGRVLREQGCEMAAEVAPWSNEDVVGAQNALALGLAAPLGGSELRAVDATRLQRRACDAFVSARELLMSEGIEVAVLSGHRSTEEQAEDYALISGLADPRTFPVAPSGQSLHERGLAVDLSYDGYLHDFRSDRPSISLSRIRNVMRSRGWFQFDRTNDPFHFSFGRIG